MNMRDLIPWGRNPQTTPGRYREESDPFMTLHREMNRLFDDVFRGFGDFSEQTRHLGNSVLRLVLTHGFQAAQKVTCGTLRKPHSNQHFAEGDECTGVIVGIRFTEPLEDRERLLKVFHRGFFVVQLESYET